MQNNFIQDLKQLKEEIKPRSEWTALNRDILLRQINPDQQLGQQVVGWSGYAGLLNQMFRQTFMEPAVMMLLVLGVFLGSSLTINAAFYALPGDNLYPVKLTLEKTHVALVTDESKQIELKIEFAQKRVAELGKVISQDDTPEAKKKKIETVAKEFRNNVSSVNSHLANIAKNSNTETKKITDPSSSFSMALTVSTKAGELAKSFDQTASELSEVEKDGVKQVVAEAVESAQEASLAAQQIVDNSVEATGAVQGVDNQSDSPTVNETVSDETDEGALPSTQPATEGETETEVVTEPVE